MSVKDWIETYRLNILADANVIVSHTSAFCGNPYDTIRMEMCGKGSNVAILNTILDILADPDFLSTYKCSEKERQLYLDCFANSTAPKIPYYVQK